MPRAHPHRARGDAIAITCDWIARVFFGAGAPHRRGSPEPLHIMLRLPAHIVRRLGEYDDELAAKLIGVRADLVSARVWRMQRRLRRLQACEEDARLRQQDACPHRTTYIECDDSDYNHVCRHRRCATCQAYT